MTTPRMLKADPEFYKHLQDMQAKYIKEHGIRYSFPQLTKLIARKNKGGLNGTVGIIKRPKKQKKGEVLFDGFKI